MPRRIPDATPLHNRAHADAPLRYTPPPPPPRPPTNASRFVIDMRVNKPLPPLQVYRFLVNVALTTAAGETYMRPTTRSIIARTPVAARLHLARQYPARSRFHPQGEPTPLKPNRSTRCDVALGTTDYLLKEGAEAAFLARSIRKVAQNIRGATRR